MAEKQTKVSDRSVKGLGGDCATPHWWEGENLFDNLHVNVSILNFLRSKNSKLCKKWMGFYLICKYGLVPLYMYVDDVDVCMSVYSFWHIFEKCVYIWKTKSWFLHSFLCELEAAVHKLLARAMWCHTTGLMAHYSKTAIVWKSQEIIMSFRKSRCLLVSLTVKFNKMLVEL